MSEVLGSNSIDLCSLSMYVYKTTSCAMISFNCSHRRWRLSWCHGFFVKVPRAKHHNDPLHLLKKSLERDATCSQCAWCLQLPLALEPVDSNFWINLIVFFFSSSGVWVWRLHWVKLWYQMIRWFDDLFIEFSWKLHVFHSDNKIRNKWRVKIFKMLKVFLTAEKLRIRFFTAHIVDDSWTVSLPIWRTLWKTLPQIVSFCAA